MAANDPIGLGISFVAVFFVAFSAWLVLTRRGVLRLLFLPLGLLALVALVTYTLDQIVMLIVLAGLLALFGVGARYAVRNHPRQPPHRPPAYPARAAGVPRGADHQSTFRRGQGRAIQPRRGGEATTHRAVAARAGRRPLRAGQAGGRPGRRRHRDGRRGRIAGAGGDGRDGARRRPRLRACRDSEPFRTRSRARPKRRRRRARRFQPKASSAVSILRR